MTQSKLKLTMLSNLKEKIHIGIMTRQWKEKQSSGCNRGGKRNSSTNGGDRY
jgi:hypothetical protein